MGAKGRFLVSQYCHEMLSLKGEDARDVKVREHEKVISNQRERERCALQASIPFACGKHPAPLASEKSDKGQGET
jgi:hypothetical protein